MASRQKQFVRDSIYHVTSPSGKVSEMQHLGNFVLKGDKILMFKLKPKPRLKKKPGQ